jgi:FAD/FMN-containing dehydrogenase
LPQAHAFYVLVEASGGRADHAERFAAILGTAMEDGLVADATVAQNERECEALWAMRDDVAQLARFGRPVGYDISLRLADTGAYVETVRASILASWPDAHIWAFGHLGDGNVHLVVHVPELDAPGHARLDQLVYAPLQCIGGAVSAEHGIGTQKKAWLHLSRTPAELAVMRLLKQSLDPKGLLNPGRVLDAA